MLLKIQKIMKYIYYTVLRSAPALLYLPILLYIVLYIKNSCVKNTLLKFADSTCIKFYARVGTLITTFSHYVLLYFGEKIKVDFLCITSIRIFPHSGEVEA